MSEAERPTPQDETPPAAPESAVPAAPRVSNAPAWLALLLAALACAGAAWTYLQQGRLAAAAMPQADLRVDELQVEQRQMRARLDSLAQDDGSQAQQQAVLADLQAQQQALAAQLQALRGDGRDELRLAEAEHLLRLASLRLAALQDVDSAIALLEGADRALREQDDPRAFAARKALAEALEALRSRPQPDRSGLYLSLGALRDEAFALTDQAPQFQRQVAAVDAEQGHWARWWNEISSYVRIDFSAEQDVRPLLAGQNLAQVRLALGLAIEQAQWALLNGEEAVYQQALAQAREVLQSHFGPQRPQVRALDARLQALAQEPVGLSSVDIAPALQAFQAYLQARRMPLDVTPEPAP